MFVTNRNTQTDANVTDSFILSKTVDKQARRFGWRFCGDFNFHFRRDIIAES